jgi:hypothetical protein
MSSRGLFEPPPEITGVQLAICRVLREVLLGLEGHAHKLSRIFKISGLTALRAHDLCCSIMQRQNQANQEMYLVDDGGESPICEEAPYPRLKPGEYSARCVEAKVYLEKRFRRWVCRVKYWIIPEGPHVYGFLNLGCGEKPRAGRGSEYRRVWIEANGDAPHRRQKLGHSVFRDKIFVIRVDDVRRRHDGRSHHQADVYSTVKEVVKRSWP